MVVYVITLEFSRKLRSKVLRIKKEAKRLVGSQLYIYDEPHMTLFIGKFRNISEFDKGLKSLALDLKNSLRSISIKGWVVFKKDIITKKQTLVCGISKKDIKKLKKAQKKIISFMQAYGEKGQIKRYQKIYDTLKGNKKNNLKKYGFPFVGKIWKPHITIPSFDGKSFSIVWKRFKNNCPKGRYGVASLNVYTLNERVSSIRIAKRYRF